MTIWGAAFGIQRSSGQHGTVRLAALLFAGSLAICAVQGCKAATPPAAVETSTAGPETAQGVAPPAAAPYSKRHIYSETADPRKDIAAALQQAKREHKRVLLEFGGDWCGDCQVLNIYFHQAPNDELLEKNFVVVPIFVNSDIDNHLDLGQKYGLNLKKGVPAFAILDATGKLVYAQKTGEAEAMSRTNGQAVTDFLNRWKS